MIISRLNTAMIISQCQVKQRQFHELCVLFPSFVHIHSIAWHVLYFKVGSTELVALVLPLELVIYNCTWYSDWLWAEQFGYWGSSPSEGWVFFSDTVSRLALGSNCPPI
jgi:hypothetical protein